MKKKKRAFVGLGNPSGEYANTYHNVGRLALDAIINHAAKDVGKSADAWKKHKDLFEYLETTDAIFVRPFTFMNESGKAVREVMKKFSPELVVLHDDSDIVIGNYKISFARSSAGHKGVQSIIDALHTNEFTRVRIGIRPAHEKHRQKAGEFALKQISKKDTVELAKVFDAIARELGYGA